MKNLQFIITNKDNKKIVCDTIATYHDDNSNKNFIIYTDGSFDEKKQLKIYYSLYEKNENGLKLIDIVLDSDRLIALQIIKELIKDTQNK